MKTDDIAARLKKKKRARANWNFGIRLFLGITFILPIIIGFVFSFVPNEELYGLPTVETVLRTFTFENYEWVFKNTLMLRWVSNSLIMCLVCIVIQLIVASLAAYAFSFFKFKGKDTLFQIILVGMMIPFQVIVIANFMTVRDWGLVNTYLGLCLPSLIAGRTIFMMRQSFLTLPRELKEAAVMDGCGEMRFLFRFAIPLSMPSIAALAMMIFIDIFNAYMWPLLISRNVDMYTVQVGMVAMMGDEIPTYGRSLAGAMLAIALPVLMFLIGQDYLVKGMTSGSVKG